MLRFKTRENFPDIATRKECSIKNNEINAGVHKNHKHLRATHFTKQRLKMVTTIKCPIVFTVVQPSSSFKRKCSATVMCMPVIRHIFYKSLTDARIWKINNYW